MPSQRFPETPGVDWNMAVVILLFNNLSKIDQKND
jgi:hypothetical protein